jgi:integrase
VNLEAGTASVVGSLHRDLEGRLAIADTKTSTSRRTLALTPTAVTTLRQHRAVQAQQRIAMGPAWQDHDLVFSTGKGTAVAPTDLHRKSFRPLLERSGVRRIRFHDLRHTAATLLLEQGIHPKVVSEMLGHSGVAITLDTYSHVSPALHQGAAAVMEGILNPAKGHRSS